MALSIFVFICGIAGLFGDPIISPKHHVVIESMQGDDPFIVFVDDSTILNFNYSLVPGTDANKKANQQLTLLISSSDSSLVEIADNNERQLLSHEKENKTFSVILKGKLPGRAQLVFSLQQNNGTDQIQSYDLYAERKDRVIDKTFTAVVIMLVVFANIGMGCKVDLTVVKRTLKRPIAPTIGLCSQFIFMPLIAFALFSIVPLEPGMALGFFTLGCSPGGSASNIYTNFLNGNVSLSVTMTLISTLAALGMIPLWLFTLGQLVYAKGDIKVPFTTIITSLIGIVIPIVVGLILQHKLPKVATFFINAVKYIIVVFFIFVFTVGIYANIYIFYLIGLEVVIASALLPYLGFMFGAIVAFVTRQKKEDIIAIAIETGIQNSGIPIILCQLSLTGPDRDTSIITPIMASIFTPIPMIFAILYVQIKAYRQKRRDINTEIDKNTAIETAEGDHFDMETSDSLIKDS